MFIKTTSFKTFSLCVLGICAATLITFSQTPDAPAPNVEATTTQVEMPVARTITDTKGRAIEGTILGKTETSITFQRAGGKKFEIKLDTLSADDQAFVGTLVAPNPLTPRKISVLFVAENGNSYNYTNYQEEVKWMKDSGFDVTVALTSDLTDNLSKDEYKREDQPIYVSNLEKKEWKSAQIPATEKTIAIMTKSHSELNTLEKTDAYDVVFFPRYDSSPHNDSKVADHRKKQGGVTVALIHKERAKKGAFGMDNIAPKNYPSKRETKNYARNDGNWIFFDDRVDPADSDKTREKVIQMIHKAMQK